jgi:hypothetical protein
MVLNKLREDAEKAIAEFDSSSFPHKHSTIINNFKAQLNNEGFNVVEVLSIVSNNSLEATTIFKTEFKTKTTFDFEKVYGTAFILNHNAKAKTYSLSIGYADLTVNSYSFYLTGNNAIEKSYGKGKYVVGIDITHGDIYDLVTDLSYEFTFTDLIAGFTTTDLQKKVNCLKIYQDYYGKKEFQDYIFDLAIDKKYTLEDLLEEGASCYALRNRTLSSFSDLTNKFQENNIVFRHCDGESFK